MADAASDKERQTLPDEAELTELLNRFDVPGIAVATLRACELDELRVAGYADASTRVSPSTAFEAASLSKPVFAWLVMSLADEGVINLDRPIARVLDYARIPDKHAYALITPRMVLMHRTGLPNWVDEAVDFHQRTTPIPFSAAPGTTYSYSGEAYQLLQALVEQQTGQALQQLFRQRLGDVMPHSTFRQPLPDGVTPSRGYASASKAAGSRAMTNLTTHAVAAGSLATTVEDYARFLGHVCKREGLHADTYAEMLRPQSPVPATQAAVPTSWGLGFMINDLGGQTFIGHEGNNDEYRSFGGFMRESGDGIVILTNGANGQALIDTLIAPKPPTTSVAEATFEEFWSIFNDGYALFGVKHVDWDAVYQVYRPRITATTTDAELWDTLTEIIDLLNDVHVTLSDPGSGRTARSGGRSIGVGPFDNGEFSVELISKAYAAEPLTALADARIRYGWLGRGIGYLHIGAFGDVDASAVAIDMVIESLASARGLIIDVRHNTGGDDRVGRLIGSRFVVEPRRYMSVAMRRIGVLPPDFEPPVQWRLEPAGPRQFDGPLVLLVNSRSISAAENFAMAMRAIPRALIIGETTAGVMADSGGVPLPNGWQVHVPFNLFRDVDGM